MRRPPTPTLKRGRQTKALADLGVSELIEIVPKPEGAKRIYGFVMSLGGGTELGEFFGLGKAGRMSVHVAKGRSVSETASFC